jgi:D-arginine dehydrogenase
MAEAVHAVDFVVIGGGIVGAACAYRLAETGRVALLDGEDAFGYHATGRSAALFSEYFGAPPVRLLTAASRAFFEAPPDGFTDTPLLSPRGIVALATADDVEHGRFAAALDANRSPRTPAVEITLDEARAMCPILAPRDYVRALSRPAVMDLDVDALHQGFLRGIRARGGSTLAGARIHSLRRDGAAWRIEAAGGHTFAAACVINAAGAWADEIAALAGIAPIGLVPTRRTAVLVDVAGHEHHDPHLREWPAVTDLADTFYFRPESGKLMVSPSDETPIAPCDVQPEELDVAIAVSRLEAVTTLQVTRIARSWAGLRSMIADDVPVLGAAPGTPTFFWAAALGGYGIQTAPAVGRAVASLVTCGRLPDDLRADGLTEAVLSPERVMV